MDFLDSLDLPTIDKKSNRVRSWYLYEQYKSLEKSQLDAARKLKNRSYQDRLLHRELNERRARRQLSEQFNVHQSESRIGKTIRNESPRTPFSESTDSIFESVCEQEDVVSEKELEEDLSQHSDTSKLDDEFNTSDDKNNNSCSESVDSVVERTEINRNIGTDIADDIKEELEFVKKNIAETINLQMETENECLEKLTRLCDETSCDDEESSKSVEKNYGKSTTKSTDKYCPKYDNGFNAIWSKLVAFSYNIMQMNRGNCYYDYSSQFLTGVLAFDVLRRGINRMCHILQPYVSPIKFANDERVTSLNNDNIKEKHPHSKKSCKIFEHKYRPLPRLNYKENYRSFDKKYRSEDRWQPCYKRTIDNKVFGTRRRGVSEPWGSVAKFSECKDCFEGNPPSTSVESQRFELCSRHCKCGQLKKAINPIIKLSKYIDMILKEIEK